MKSEVTTIPQVIRNDQGVYSGDLRHYFKVVFLMAQNINNPYHNLRHVLHVLWLCYDAAVFYGRRLPKRKIRNLLIAALFHDFDHPGKPGNDDLNIERAIRGLRKHVLPEDRDQLDAIENLIRATEFPHKPLQNGLGISAQIIRDADLSQALDSAWIQQVICGLAQERGENPLEVLKAQAPFHEGLKFQTEWAQQRFPRSAVEAKIAEATELLELLE